ncbi:MAG TPA: type VI secretion system tip protein TssI/VgrG [Ramlibacter sp.]|uniref:type VI secretion system Vgr family protein n=1 Tax=Ramlibacter sp. TaxID=1917967 RepID=UPI002CC9850C|nr:type VI secretion system tip protein TssI/VgrG [Ramlibacter sp.]HVZ43832.1 type VI secretion system tip protein TssI/VgrG [Ramlibacter sp.]
MTTTRTGFTQASAFMAVTTPFGADKLILDALEGTEGISQPFRFSLSMRGDDTSLDPATIVGQSVTVTLKLGTADSRYFNGICSRFLHIGGDREFTAYSAEVVPKLWLLTLTRDRKIYQNKSVSDIVKAVLGDFGITISDKLTGTYTAREYCVQHDETAFEFISRLMEEEGIFYFFTFADGAHTMVLADATSAHTDCPGAATLTFHPKASVRERIDQVQRFEFESRLVAQKFTLNDYDFEQPSTALKGENAGTGGKGTQYEYPGGKKAVADHNAKAKIRVEAQQVQSAIARGQSFCYALTAGTKFTLSGHPRAALNAAHVVRSVTHSASNEHYSNAFEAFPATVPFRPPRITPRPRVAGSQIATVVGPSGEEIWTDKHGRIKVLFAWDTLGKKDDTASCWVRVSQTWAGQGWGALFIPRVGQEVVVSYVDGDPDRPLVTGAVYNAEKTPPVTLPSNSTQSTIKTRSSKQGSAGNEIRFEDKKDSEELYVHAQKDMKVEIENMLTTTVKESHETHTIEKGNRTVEVKTGTETHNVKGTRTLEITGNESHTNKADFKQEVTGNYELKVTGNLTIDVTGSIVFKGAKDMSIKAGTTLAAEAGTSYTAKAGTALTNQAGTALTNKAGTDLSNEGLNVKNKGSVNSDVEGTMVNVKASATGTVDGGGMLTVKGGLVKIN